MQDPAKQKKRYQILSTVFLVGTLIWLVGVIIQPGHWLLYSFVALINGGISWYCRQESRR
jgi:fatty acid desaturase